MKNKKSGAGWIDGWVGGWMDGWMGGWWSRFKDCLQQSKIWRKINIMKWKTIVIFFTSYTWAHERVANLFLQISQLHSISICESNQ